MGKEIKPFEKLSLISEGLFAKANLVGKEFVIFTTRFINESASFFAPPDF